MLTHKIDGALDALLACMMRLPALRDCYRPGTPERTALDDLMASLQQTDAVLFNRGGFNGGGSSSARGPADLQARRDHRT